MEKLYVITVISSLLIGNVSANPPLPYDVEQLVQQRERAIKKIDDKYLIELEKIKIRYIKLGNLEVANSINLMIIALNPDLGDQLSDNGIVGNWEFEYEGKKRIFKFMSNSKFTGQYIIDGREFSGEWRESGKEIELFYVKKKIRMKHYLKIVSSDTLIFVGPRGSMEGSRK